MPDPDTGRATFGAALAGARHETSRTLLRRRDAAGGNSVSNLELFFDLVYVFAITQLSHFLLERMDATGTLQAAILLFAVWWAWVYTTWATNWIDPDRGPNRLAIGAVMLASLVLGCAIPTAFGKGGPWFAAAYVAIQVGRTLWVARARGEFRRNGARNLLRIAVWFMASALPWAAGALAADPAYRMAWWAFALAIEYTAPLLFYAVPGMGRSTSADWDISGAHMAERCGLFIIIALGEGLVITGATFAAAEPRPGLAAAFVNAFVGSFALWWLYFDIGARRGAHHIEHAEDPGRIARNAFTYWHLPIVAGIVVLAVADELSLAHPMEPAHFEFLAIACAGMALFLWGNMAFKRISSGNPWNPLSHSFGLALVAMLAVWGLLAHPTTLAFSIAGTGVFIFIAAWEWGSFHGGWLERMEARDWRLGHWMRRFSSARVARRRERAARKGR
ncbi:low temperature requirement protein A [Novosphingobium sp. ZN18A2]|uniref:low temperature requirement protein A n=1 Tax=Novosphingobium sp. ZN18A2 TaxID=3079861 RepID=UPI0030D59D9D